MLGDLDELRTFVRIVAAGSLSAAGREMNLALSVVSKRLASLERRTDTRLVARSTRRLALTEEGQRLYRHAQRILAEVAEAEEALSHGRVEPQGVLRVGAPAALGRMHVGPVCRELVQAYPRISVDLRLTDRMVDLIDEGLDVAVRIAAPGIRRWSCAGWPTITGSWSVRRPIWSVAAGPPRHGIWRATTASSIAAPVGAGACWDPAVRWSNWTPHPACAATMAT